MLNKRFISFEGGEGSGKSTQIKILAKKLSLYRKVIVTREPGGTPEAEKIRKLIVKDSKYNWDSVTETLLLFASRREHIEKVIKPSLQKGYWVLSDRFIDSTIAYQANTKKVDSALINFLIKSIVKDFTPKLTFYLDIDPMIGLKRSIKKKNNKDLKYEKMELNFHRKVRRSFIDIANANKKRISVIDALREKNIISENIWEKTKLLDYYKS